MIPIIKNKCFFPNTGYAIANFIVLLINVLPIEFYCDYQSKWHMSAASLDAIAQLSDM